ncbi:metallophosphoesterase [Phycisphaeraceae bacterium D3-23]
MPLAYGLTESVDVGHPAIPATFSGGSHAKRAVSGGAGLRVAHLTDLHITKPTSRLNRLIYQLNKVRLDLGLLTGDYMVRHRSPDAAVRYLKELTKAVKPAHGWFGVLGNHDTPEFIEQTADLPIHWLVDEAVALDDLPIDLIGLGREGRKRRPDGAKAALAVGELPDDYDADENTPARLRLALTHRPDDLPLCADLGAHLAFAGHTHGGQVRLPWIARPLFNATDLPVALNAGMIRHQNTLMLVPRGIGSTDFFKLPIYPRLFCPPHAPIYTLRHAILPGEYTNDIASLWKW